MGYYIYTWTDENREETILIVDEDTVFDETCEMQFFNGWQKGQTPVEWYQQEYEKCLLKDGSYHDSLQGVFDVEVTGSHVNRLVGLVD